MRDAVLAIILPRDDAPPVDAEGVGAIVGLVDALWISALTRIRIRARHQNDGRETADIPMSVGRFAAEQWDPRHNCLQCPRMSGIQLRGDDVHHDIGLANTTRMIE